MGRTWRLFSLLFACSAATDKFGKFRKWLVDYKGATIGDVDFGTDKATGLRGLVTTARVSKGAVLFELPADLILTVGRAQAEGESWQKCSADSDADGFAGTIHTSLALFLLEQREKGSEWGPWVSVLPESFEGFSYFMTDDDLAGLQASPLRRVFEVESASLEKDYAAASKVMPDLALDDFKWARLAVKSRVFSLSAVSHGAMKQEDSDPLQDIAMMPFADFVNHPPDGVVDANVAPRYDPQTRTMRFETTSSIPKGKGIYWDYGFKSNRHSLSRYGFTNFKRVPLTDMPFFFNLKTMPTKGQARDIKLAAMSKADSHLAIDSDGEVLHELDLSLMGTHADKLMGHFRFMAFRPRDESHLDEYCPNTFCRPISLQNERAAFLQFATELVGLMGKYETTAEQDQELIEQRKILPSDGTRWNTLMIRYGEKRILNGYGNLIQAMTELFELTPWALEDKIQENWNDPDSDVHRYVREVIADLIEQKTVQWVETRKALKE